MDCQIVPSVCSFCGTGCGVLFQTVNGRVTGTLPMKGHPVNEGKLCIKGWSLHEHINSFMRLKTPLLRRQGKFNRVSWDEAVAAAAGKLASIAETYGPESIGVLVSAKITNEENYLAQKFARAVIGTNNVDHCARL
jgi:predicted molibdopterin-dependent oxidoreductase YjgC